VTAAVGPRALLAAIAAGAVAVLALWWHSTLVISGLGGWLTGTGEILGLLAGYGVIVLVLLMARIPPIERSVGADRLARWHAMGGRYVISLITAHVIAITWGFAVNAHTNPVTESGTLITAYPDVLMATVAWVLLLGVAYVSARAVRRKLRYETWYYLHFYTYLAVALAFSHQFSNGAAFATDITARFWWSCLYGVVAALVLWYRIVVPLRDYVRHGLRVAGVRRESPRTVSIYIKGQRLREFNAEPGQFFRWRFLTRDLWWQSHPFSLSAAPGEDLLRITVQDVGDFSAALGKLKPGTRVSAEGPFGSFIPVPADRSTLLLAGGVGITPLRAIFATLSGKVTLIYRASTWQDVVFQSELDAIAEARGATVHYVVGSRSDLGADPISAKTLRQLAPGVQRMDVYLCGPPGMTGTAVAALTEAGVPRHRIHCESFEF
jgi:predicted ferric reductase